MALDADVRLETDVLVLGGGPAGAWAAWSAASRGAKVAVAEKGFLGSSGATAPGGTTMLVVPPVKELRDKAVQERMKAGGYISEAAWIYRVLDQVDKNLELLEKWGYPFPKYEGQPIRTHVHGPEYMRLMRRQLLKAGVLILDQSPALELLADEHGVGGARGINRLNGKTWEVRAHAVVVATGGCAFMSNGLGCNVLTGEGLLMAAEIGAELSGMEFTRHYGVSPAFASNTRSRMLTWATFYDEAGNVLHRGRRAFGLMPQLFAQGPVYAVLDLADTEEKREFLRRAHPIFFMPFERAGINPFKERFELKLRYEGTVRGVGGLRLTGPDCATTIKGLYAAGDAATREKVTGAISGAGAYNASWAICSGTWAGEGAANYALARKTSPGKRNLAAYGRIAVPAGAQSGRLIDARELVEAVQREILPIHINYFRSEPVLRASLHRLHALMYELEGQAPADAFGKVRAREAAAMVTIARWMYTAALARKETRGLHGLKEYPNLDLAQTHRIILSGIENIRVSTEAVPHAHELTAEKERLLR